MKASLIALVLAASAATAPAFAANQTAGMNSADAPQAHQWTAAQNAPAAKTRAEVRQELARATRSGELASLNRLYQGS